MTDENGNRVYQTNIGDVSTGGSTRVIEGKMINEYYMLQPYKGSGNGFNADGTVNINGGPRDGMIRTVDDMKWLNSRNIDSGRFLWVSEVMVFRRLPPDI